MATTKSTKTAPKTMKEFVDVETVTKKGAEMAAKSYDDIISFNQDNFEAIVEFGKATAKGVEELNAEVLAFNKVALEENIAAAKAVMGAKTVQEAVDLQTEWAKAWFDSYMSQATKVGELTAKVAQEAFAPVNDRLTAAVEKVVKPAAL